MKLRECSLTALTRTISERCEVRVAGMPCQSCVRKITAALEAEEAVLSCEVSLETESASVEFDPDLVTAEDIELAINNVGPKVREMMHVELSLYLTTDHCPQFSASLHPGHTAVTMDTGDGELEAARAPAQGGYRCWVRVQGMTCASCVATIESKVGGAGAGQRCSQCPETAFTSSSHRNVAR